MEVLSCLVVPGITLHLEMKKDLVRIDCQTPNGKTDRQTDRAVTGCPPNRNILGAQNFTEVLEI